MLLPSMKLVFVITYARLRALFQSLQKDIDHSTFCVNSAQICSEYGRFQIGNQEAMTEARSAPTVRNKYFSSEQIHYSFRTVQAE